MSDEGSRADIDVRRHVAEVWRCWVDPIRLADWFGIADRRLDRRGRKVRIDFGDGDFLAVEVLAAEPPYRLHLRWRFVGIGEPDEVAVDIAPIPDGSLVTVTDTGLLGPDAEGVCAGWQDFLARLKHYCETREVSRYGWSADIAFGFRAAHVIDVKGLGRILSTVLDMARRRGHWATLLNVEATGSVLDAQVEHPALTEATDVRMSVDRGRVVVLHTGWDRLDLSEEDQRMARSAWLDLWLEGIAELRVAR